MEETNSRLYEYSIPSVLSIFGSRETVIYQIEAVDTYWEESGYRQGYAGDLHSGWK